MQYLQAPFPDPRKKEAWNKPVPAFPAKHGAKENLSYEQQATSMRKYLNHLKIYIKKLIHAWRVAGSRTMDAAGMWMTRHVVQLQTHLSLQHILLTCCCMISCMQCKAPGFLQQKNAKTQALKYRLVVH